MGRLQEASQVATRAMVDTLSQVQKPRQRPHHLDRRRVSLSRLRVREFQKGGLA